MSDAARTEMIRGFIEEVKTYVPQLKENLQTLRSDASEKDVLEETHRLVHTVKGASSMVGLTGLSQIAAQMETDLDQVLGGRYDLTSEAISVMTATVDQFQRYCEKYFNGGTDTHAMLKSVAADFCRLRRVPLDPDGGDLEALCQDIPPVEGIALPPSASVEVLTAEPDPSTVSNADTDITPIDALLAEDNYENPSLSPLDDSLPPEDQMPLRQPSPPLNPELLESFLMEAEEHLDDLGHALNRLETGITDPQTISDESREEIRRIRRSVHTLKGAAAVIGMGDFSQFAHRLEDLLDWLYETAQDISPAVVGTLTESSDLLARMTGQPDLAHSENAMRLQKEYRTIMGVPETTIIDSPATVESEVGSTSPRSTPAESGPSDLEWDDPAPKSNHSAVDDISPLQATQTLRVSMDRVDELVYLAGELIIASSVLDQKMETFNQAVEEIELTRSRLRDIAREMELSYEVKALEHLSPSLNLNHFGSGTLRLAREFEDFDSLELDRYSELNMIIRSLNESVVDIGAINNQLTGVYGDFDGNLNRFRVIISELQDKIMRVRMTPMSLIANRMRRTVRETAAQLNKQVQLVIEGEDIELDRMVWDKITDPLMHLLRNAVDHGAETAEVRQSRDKIPATRIRLQASREGNQVHIRVGDDGAGLDYDAIRQTARQHGVAADLDSLDDTELADFIFHPGFSTRRQVSEISGRGVGMDIVRENIRSLKGDIQVRSSRHQGTEFTLRIPLTLAAVRALLFSVDGQTYAIALNEISQILRGDPRTMMIQEDGLIRIDQEIMPLFPLAEILNPLKEGQTSLALEESPLMLILDLGTQKAAVIIDALVGQREIVIKSLGSHLRHVKGISGATILGDGRVVPILNLQEMLWSSDTSEELSPAVTAAPNMDTPLRIMIVDDSVSIRNVVARLVENQGWQAVTAKDGVDALEKMRDQQPDLIVLDIEMPRMNGYEFLAALRANPADSQIPVVMLSSRATGKHRDKALSLGARAFVVKPYNDEEFVDLMMQLTISRSPRKGPVGKIADRPQTDRI